MKWIQELTILAFTVGMLDMNATTFKSALREYFVDVEQVTIDSFEL